MIIRQEDRIAFFVSLFVGAVLGGVLGEVFKRYIPLLAGGVKVGFKPVTLDLYILMLTFGFNFKITVAAIIGMLLAFILIIKK